jgi:hypothetical protein
MTMRDEFAVSTDVTPFKKEKHLIACVDILVIEEGA